MRSTVLACLKDDEEQIRFEAGMVLAEDQAHIGPAEQAALVRAYESLSGRRREEAGRVIDLGRAGSSSSISGLRSWIEVSPDEEINARVGELIVHLHAEGDRLGLDDATAVVETLKSEWPRLDEQFAAARIDEVLAVSIGWLRRAAGRRQVRTWCRHLFVWDRLRAEYLTSFAAVADALLADQARTVLEEALSSEREQDASVLLGMAASTALDQDVERRLAVPVLATKAGETPEAIDAAFGFVSEVGQRRLLAAALAAGKRCRERGCTVSSSARQRQHRSPDPPPGDRARRAPGGGGRQRREPAPD